MAHIVKGYLCSTQTGNPTHAVVASSEYGKFAIVALKAHPSKKAAFEKALRDFNSDLRSGLNELRELVVAGDTASIENEWGFKWKPVDVPKTGLTAFLEKTA